MEMHKPTEMNPIVQDKVKSGPKKDSDRWGSKEKGREEGRRRQIETKTKGEREGGREGEWERRRKSVLVEKGFRE